MHKGIFITGTDTEVGKTYVVAGLITAFMKMGFKVCPMKPVETGCAMKGEKLIPQDVIKLIKTADTKEPIDIISPYRFKLPLAPAVASEIEGYRIDKRRIFSAYKYLSCKYDITLVEGAGGIMAPVYKKYLFLDLIKDLNLPIIIVSRPSLGTINHTLLTIEAVKGRGIDILGVIINYSSKVKKGLAEKTAPDAIERLGGVSILGAVPYSNTNTPYLKRVFYEIMKKIQVKI
ncbi:MAG: dethiobiotin synthase [Nitrospirae bacterium]|nr:dethiobiotin synthase [Nitrospirota bacterium]